jgi:voltage-gated potassium channel Kch
MLKANGFDASILDLDPNSIRALRKHGLEVYYGDAARHDLLETAGCAVAKVLIIAVDDRDRSRDIAELARRHFPDLTIIARAKDARHAFLLRQHGVDRTVCEAEHGGIGLGETALRALGWGAWRAARAARRFRQHQSETHRQLIASWGDEKAMLDVQRSRVADLDQQLDADDQDKALQTDQAWRTGLVKATLAENQ